MPSFLKQVYAKRYKRKQNKTNKQTNKQKKKKKSFAPLGKLMQSAFSPYSLIQEQKKAMDQISMHIKTQYPGFC